MEVQRFTKYPLLLENMAKYTGNSCSADSRGPRQKFRECGIPEASHISVLNSCEKLLSRVLKISFCCSVAFFHTEDEEEKEKVKRAEECCKKILNHVNQAVKEAENKQVELATVDFFHFTWNPISTCYVFSAPKRLQEYQRRLDISSLKQGDHPMILELKARSTCCIQEEPDHRHSSRVLVFLSIR